MAELNEGEWEIDGLLVQDAKWSVVAVEGLGDSADLAPQLTDLGTDGQALTSMRLTQRNVTIVLDLDPEDSDDKIDQLALLADAMAPSADRVTPKVVRWRRVGQETRLAYFTPAQGRSLELPDDEANLIYHHPRNIKCHLFCADPVMYSDATTAVSYTVTGGTPVSHTVTNAGTLPAVSAGAWSVSLTASGTVQRPVIQHGSATGERAEILRNLASGEVLTIGTDRIVRVDGIRSTAIVRGASGCPVAGWPVIRPGAQSISLGASAGNFSATFTYRSTW